MPRKLKAYTEEILESIRQIESFINGIDFIGFAQDSKTKAAVERKLLNIGEALNQAKQVNSKVENEVTEFRKIVGFRNILVHGYFGVDDALVWDIITTKLELLKSEVQLLSNEIEDSIK